MRYKVGDSNTTESTNAFNTAQTQHLNRHFTHVFQ